MIFFSHKGFLAAFPQIPVHLLQIQVCPFNAVSTIMEGVKTTELLVAM